MAIYLLFCTNCATVCLWKSVVSMDLGGDSRVEHGLLIQSSLSYRDGKYSGEKRGYKTQRGMQTYRPTPSMHDDRPPRGSYLPAAPGRAGENSERRQCQDR